MLLLIPFDQPLNRADSIMPGSSRDLRVSESVSLPVSSHVYFWIHRQVLVIWVVAEPQWYHLKVRSCPLEIIRIYMSFTRRIRSTPGQGVSGTESR